MDVASGETGEVTVDVFLKKFLDKFGDAGKPSRKVGGGPVSNNLKGFGAGEVPVYALHRPADAPSPMVPTRDGLLSGAALGTVGRSPSFFFLSFLFSSFS